MNKKIRSMVLADVGMVVEVEQHSFITPWSAEAFITELTENELAYYFVAEIDGKVVGYAGMWLILDEAHVTNVAVLPEYRQQRLGYDLMTALLDFARTKGAVRMTLEVRQSNETAKHLYQGLGFMPRGVRRQYYTDTREDAIIMWRDEV